MGLWLHHKQQYYDYFFIIRSKSLELIIEDNKDDHIKNNIDKIYSIIELKHKGT